MLQPSIPNEVLPFVLGGALWFGCSYLYIAPELTARAIDMHIADECQQGGEPELCGCIFDDITAGSGVVNNAIFVASFGLSEPSISWWGGSNKRNPVIEYVSQKSRNRDRVHACRIGDTPLVANHFTTIATAEDKLKADFETEKQRIKDQADADYEVKKIADRKQHDVAIEAERKERLQLEIDATNKAKEAADIAAKAATDAADKIKNSPVGDFVEGEIETAKRIYKISEDKTEEMLSWAEILIEKSKRLRNQKMREWGIER